MALRIPSYLRRAHKLSVKQGWHWEYQTGSSHVKVFSPTGAPVTNISLTAYDGPLTKKVMSQLRKAGCPGL